MDVIDLEQVRSELADRYDVEREIGRGGMSIIYLAEDLRHDRKVAIKFLKPDLASLVGAQRFLREIQIEARLEHPNILSVFDSGEAFGVPYYIMPYIEGESLRERIVREGQLSIDDTLTITREVAEALTCAHADGVVHRDIKPENILLSNGHAVVADFGIARAISLAGDERVTETGHSVGTPAYMSPEQASGDARIDGRSDIYSLGCVVYEMLTGEPPFSGATAQAVIARHMLERPPSLEIVRPAAPAPVIRAVEKALEKTPADRFDTASDFVAALERPAESPTWAKTLRWMAMVASVVAVVFAGLTIWQIFLKPGPPLDRNKVVVFPLIERGDQSEAQAGWGVALAIEGALDHAEPLKSIDGWGRLPEQIRADATLLTPDMAREIARERTAGFFIHGVIDSTADSLRVLLRLHDVEGDSVVRIASSAQHAETASVAQLGLRAVTELLPSLIDPDRRIDLSALERYSQSATALWLQGEREYRQSRFTAALEFYERAIEEDSTLAFAAVKGAQAASWAVMNWRSGRDKAIALTELAVEHDSVLPTKYRHLARGLQAYYMGEADTASAHLHLALEADPEWAEAATALAESYYHLLPAEAPLDSLAEFWFRFAVESDTTFKVPMLHLAEIELRNGNIERAEELVDQVMAGTPDPARGRQLMYMLGCVRSGVSNFQWHEAVQEDVGAALFAGKELSVAAAQSPCAKAAFSALLDSDEVSWAHKWGALQGLNALLMAEGQVGEALALLDSVYESGRRQAGMFWLYNAVASGEMLEPATASEARMREATGEYYESTNSLSRWLGGTWNAYYGEVDRAARIAEDLAAQAAETGSRQTALLAGSLAAHVAAARGDTSEAIALLRELQPNGPIQLLSWSLYEPLGLERLLLARLLLSTEQYEEVLAVASAFDHQEPMTYVACLRPSLNLRIDAAEALGRRSLAEEYRRRLDALDSR